MADDIIRDVEELLMKEQVGVTPTLEQEVRRADVAPYSDKLMLAHMCQMGSGAVSIYGTYLGLVHRRDLGLMFTKLIKDGLQYASEGIDLLVKRGWLEQPPAWSNPMVEQEL